MTMDSETYNDYLVLQDSLVIGIDTNYLVAKAIFGFIKIGENWFTTSADGQFLFAEFKIPNYSGNLEDAFRIVNFCQVFALDMLRNGNWYCELRLTDGSEIYHANGTLEMSICRAALKAAAAKYVENIGAVK